ncbi:putative transcriptional regulator of viral defense system [Mucilaginibacter sp. UYP25]|uniref:type IV toxin-antitoxin system AbiEi family antitoxin domain-containing protein n=1 Tax=unclassified Mucilaginibacter TaxID=2617802 RepID=UPI003390916A
MEDIKDKTLNKQSAQLLALLHGDDVKAFTLGEAYQRLPAATKFSVRQLVGAMVNRGLLMRIKDGLFYVIPYETPADEFMPDWHLLAKYLVGNARHYIGYYSAMQIHSLITQPALSEQIVVDKQIKPSTLKIKDVTFQFIYHNKEHFFGGKNTWVDSFHKVACSDLEKTFVDALYKPEYAGGITEIAKALYKIKDKLDYSKMLVYLEKFGTLAVFKRLGYLLELLDIVNPISEQLQKKEVKAYYLLEPNRPRAGKMNSRWHIQENVDRQSILSPLYT